MTHRTDVLIIGTGFSGLGMAIQLLNSGRDDFVIVEKAHDVGGTWRDNTYPGCECDIQSHMYSFSYEQNPNWSKHFSQQPEIWEYLKDVANRHRLYDKVHFGVEVSGAEWNEATNTWSVRSTDGDEYEARVVASGIGGLHIPNIPSIAGAESFTGPRFHSAQWDHDVDLTGKRVAVIGTGASAIQFIPIIAEQVGDLTVFQRTAPWVLPKPDGPIPDWQKTVFEKVPLAQRAWRTALYSLLESRAIGFNGQFPWILKMGEKISKGYLERKVDDPETRAKLTPNFDLGCKRVLQSNTYFKTYNRENVHLNTDGIREITATGVVDNNGEHHEVDVIIYGTGFHVTDAFDYVHITGIGGVDLAKQFDEHGIETYLGMTVHDFPNLFFMLGPNTALGHNSVVFMIEQQAKYIVRALDAMDERNAAAMNAREEAQREFNDTVQEKLVQGIWSQGGCTSWYLDSKGKNRTIWPGFTFVYWWICRNLRAGDYDFIGVREGAAYTQTTAAA